MSRLCNLFLVVALMVFTTGCISTEKSAEKVTSTPPAVGVVDTARIFRESTPGKNGVNFLEQVQLEMQEELNKLQEAIQKDPENKELQQSVQAIYMQYQQRIGAEEQNVVNILNDLMLRTIADYRVNKKFLVIVSKEATLAYDNSVDVSSDIIAELNKHDIKFKSVVPEEPAAAPKAEEKAAPEADAPKEDVKEEAKEAAPASAEEKAEPAQPAAPEKKEESKK